MLSHVDKFSLRDRIAARRVGRRAAPGARAEDHGATECTSCELKSSLCGMCPANGELENGDAETPVDFLCRVAHLRAYAFDLPVAPHGPCEDREGGAGYDEMMRSVAALKANAAGDSAKPPIEDAADAGGAVRGRLRQRRLLVVLRALTHGRRETTRSADGAIMDENNRRQAART